MSRYFGNLQAIAVWLSFEVVGRILGKENEGVGTVWSK
jgi:hypothetical protein